MTREEYMKRLEHRLRRLPREDYNKAVSYFTEYFEDAGPDNEAQAIEDLGEPEMAADQIVREFAVENAKEPVKTVKRSFSAVWIGVLAVFAAPVALPLALAFGAVCLAFALVVIAFVFSVFLMAFAVAVSSVPCMVIGIWLSFTSFADGVATLGIGLISLGAGSFLVMGSITLGKWLMHAVTCLFGRIVRGGTYHEK